jgi:hypothetical protein
MRWVVGLLLVFAAILKSVQFVTEPAAALVTGRWLLSLEIGVELGVGLLALAGLYWRELRWIALLLFTCFATYSFYLAIGGAASCGCFGPLEVHPWWTFFLDLAVVLGLLFSVRRDRAWTAAADAVAPRPTPNSAGRPMITAAVVAVSVLGVALLGRLADHRTASAGGFSALAGDLVILEPSEWVGKSLPIADSIDLDLSSGKWIVLLHRHDCPACQEALPRYEELASRAPVAFVEIPPYGESFAPHDGSHVRLKDDREWFVQTPVEIQLQDGIVTAANHDHETSR